MGEIKIGERALGEFTDTELVTWCKGRCKGYRPNSGSLLLWVGVLRHIDDVGPPVTVRGLFYGLESKALVAKSEAGYRRVQRVALQMRRHGALAYDFVADSTRWMRKPTTYTGLEAYLEEGAKGYRRAVWANQSAYVEIWCEKDALAGLISDVTEPWDVPLMVSRGFASESYLYAAGEAMKAQGKPCYVYYFGDHDKQGLAIPRQIKKRMRDFGASFHFERVAVLPWQIKAWGLPTRPAKATAKGWRGRCVDLDAVPANTLRGLVQECIERHIDKKVFANTLRAEELERQSLRDVRENLYGYKKLA